MEMEPYTWRKLTLPEVNLLPRVPQATKHLTAWNPATPRHGQYLAHAQNHITLVVPARDSCSPLELIIIAQPPGPLTTKRPCFCTFYCRGEYKAPLLAPVGLIIITTLFFPDPTGKYQSKDGNCRGREWAYTRRKYSAAKSRGYD